MLKLIKRTVVLPDDKRVTVCDTEESWWTVHGATGYLDPALLAPDLDQPRKDMDPGKLDVNFQSISEKGVLDYLVITPRTLAPWARVAKEHEGLFHLVVSGHRRRRNALRAKLGAVPVRIAIYPNENAYRTEAGLLNAGRDDLNELEQGFEFVRLRSTGATYRQIRSAWGINEQQVHGRIHLTRLHPDLHRLLIKDKAEKRVLSITAGGILGGLKVPTAQELDELSSKFVSIVDPIGATGHESYDALNDDERRFAEQKLLVAVMRKKRLNAVCAAEFFRTKSLIFVVKKRGASRHDSESAEKHQPARRKDILSTFVRQVVESQVALWPSQELERLYANSTHEEVDAAMKEIKAGGDVFLSILRTLGAIRDKKHRTSAEVLALMQRGQKAAK